MPLFKCRRHCADGVHLFYEMYAAGPQPPVVLVRGLGSQMIQWPQTLIDSLAAHGFPVLMFDNRDAGLSTVASASFAEYSLVDMASDVVELLDHLGLPRVHVAGISMGGKIVQILSAFHPERLISAASIMSFSCSSHEVLAGLPTAEAPSLSLSAADVVYEDFIEHGSRGKYKYDAAYARDLANRVAARRVLSAEETFARQVAAMLRTDEVLDGRALAAACRVPLLVVHGDDDRLVATDLGRETARLAPNAHLRIIEGMAHEVEPQLGGPLGKLLAAFFLSAPKESRL